MTQPFDEASEVTSDDEFNGFLGKIDAEKLAKQDAQIAEFQRAILLTELLKSPDCSVVCLSYPDGTFNPDAFTLFTDGKLDEIPSGLDYKTAVANEKWLYAAISELLDASSNPYDARFSIVSEGKQQLIAAWMRGWRLPFTSNWVSFLRDVLPGGEVSEADIDKKSEEIIEGNKERAETIEKIADIFEHNSSSSIDESSVGEQAERYFKSAFKIIYDMMSGISMPKGELDFRFAKLQAEFAISGATQLECLKLCAKLCDVDISKHM